MPPTSLDLDYIWDSIRSVFRPSYKHMPACIHIHTHTYIYTPLKYSRPALPQTSSPTRVRVHSLTHSLTHLHSPTHSPTHSLTHSLTHLHSLTHSLTHPCSKIVNLPLKILMIVIIGVKIACLEPCLFSQLTRAPQV